MEAMESRYFIIDPPYSWAEVNEQSFDLLKTVHSRISSSPPTEIVSILSRHLQVDTALVEAWFGDPSKHSLRVDAGGLYFFGPMFADERTKLMSSYNSEDFNRKLESSPSTPSSSSDEYGVENCFFPNNDDDDLNFDRTLREEDDGEEENEAKREGGSLIAKFRRTYLTKPRRLMDFLNEVFRYVTKKEEKKL